MLIYRTLTLVSLTFAVALVSGCGNDDDNGGGDTPTGAIEVSADTSTTAANDLRGLTFATDGKIYASGHSDADADDRKTVVLRFNADGTPDQTFGEGDGVVELNLADGGDEQSLGIVELADGDIVVAVSVADGNGGELITADDNPAVTAEREEGVSILLVRLDDGGEVVTTFGTDGVAEVVFGWANGDNEDWPVPPLSAAEGFAYSGYPRDSAWDLQVDASGDDEKLVVFGFGPAAKADGGEQRVDNDRYVARVLASTGAADPEFNGGAAFTWNSPQGTLGDNARRGLVQSDGTIVSAGYTNLGAGLGNHIVLIRLTPDGELDDSFTGFGLDPVQNGVAVFNPFLVDQGFAECYGVGQQSDGSYVTTGYGRATGDGVPSTLGYATSTAQDLVTFRVADGEVDTSWGNDGTQAIQSEPEGPASTEERGRDLVVLSDDRTVQVGRYAGGAAIYVFTPDGELDTSVDDDGILELTDTTITAQFFVAALSADGSRIATTTNSDDNGARLVILDVDN